MIIGAGKLSAETREAIAEFVKQMNRQVEITPINESGHGIWGVNFKYVDYEGRKVVEETYMTTKDTPRRVAQFVVEFSPTGDPKLALEGDWTPMWLVHPSRSFSDWILNVMDELSPTPFTAMAAGLEDLVVGEDEGEDDEEGDCGYEGYDDPEKDCAEDCDGCACYKCEDDCEGCDLAPEESEDSG